MQTFIEGTSFDAIETMAVNYVLDVLTISGSGSKTYQSGVALSFTLMNTFVGGQTTTRDYTVTVSGATVSWNVPNTCTLVIFAEPNAGTLDSAYGFQIFQYINDVRTVKISPNFVPYCLVQVIDVPAGQRIVQTSVPAARGFMAFHRSMSTTSGQLDLCWWEQTTQNGFYALNFPSAGANQTGCRVYIFSDYLVNIPAWGFYGYNAGTMVWHSNCLPLRIIPSASLSSLTSSTPRAVSSCVTGHRFIPQDPAFPTGYSNFQCSAAGYRNGKYEVSASEIFQSTYISNEDEGRRMKQWVVGGLGVIDCASYDQYYKYALGIN